MSKEDSNLARKVDFAVEDIDLRLAVENGDLEDIFAKVLETSGFKEDKNFDSLNYAIMLISHAARDALFVYNNKDLAHGLLEKLTSKIFLSTLDKQSIKSTFRTVWSSLKPLGGENSLAESQIFQELFNEVMENVVKDD